MQTSKILTRIKISAIIEEFTDKSFITHLQFSPCSNFLSFFIREPSKHYSFSTRLMIIDWRRGCIISEVEDTSIITHYTWLGQQILMYCRYNNSFQYVIYNIDSGSYTCFKPFKDLPDGHPSTMLNTGVVTDTYPNRLRQQQLYYLAKNSTSPKLLGSFYSPLRYRDYSRIDLHPRLHSDNIISIDCSYNGRISMVLLRV